MGSRKNQHIVLFFFNVFLSFVISFQNVIYVFTSD
jgi:hypothetical protein